MSIQLGLPPVAGAQNGRIWTALVLTGTQPAPNQIGGSSARSNAAVFTQCNRLASGPVLALIPPEAGMPAHADLLRGRIECAAGV
jgi:hypothetical protein